VVVVVCYPWDFVRDVQSMSVFFVKRTVRVVIVYDASRRSRRKSKPFTLVSYSSRVC